MKTSIVISTYNGEKYIEEELLSIVNQIIMPDEVLIFDDLSNDNTVKIIEDFIDKHNLKNWKISVNTYNKGWRVNFIDGIEKASGDIIFIADQDDIWQKDKIKTMKDIMMSNSNINLLTSNYLAFFEDGKTYVGPNKNDNSLEMCKIDYDLFNTKYPGCTYCVRRTFFLSCLEYWNPDFEHDAFLLKLSSFNNSAYSINMSLIKWRRHNESTYTIESKNLKRLSKKIEWIDYALKFLDCWEKYLKDNNLHKYDNFIKANRKWCALRLKLYKEKKFIYWLRLIKYLRCYSRIRQYFGDLYLVLFSHK